MAKSGERDLFAVCGGKRLKRMLYMAWTNGFWPYIRKCVSKSNQSVFDTLSALACKLFLRHTSWRKYSNISWILSSTHIPSLRYIFISIEWLAFWWKFFFFWGNAKKREQSKRKNFYSSFISVKRFSKTCPFVRNMIDEWFSDEFSPRTKTDGIYLSYYGI